MITLITPYQWIGIAAIIVYSATILSVIYVVISENRNPVRSLAWVTVLMFLPVIGLALYLFFGRSIKIKAVISKRMRRKLMRKERIKQVEIPKLPLSNESKQLVKLGQSLTGSIYFPGNDVEIFTEGKEMFARLIDDLTNAKKYIDLQFYIFEDDNIGKEISHILIEKAKQGVEVRVIYDHVGCFKVSKRFYREMAEAGIEVHPFFKVTFPEFATRINWRNHRKIVVIDGETGYIGGMNIADRYISTPGNTWRDTHLRLKGKCIFGLAYSFGSDWAFMGLPPFNEEISNYAPAIGDEAGIQIMTSGPFGQWHNIALMFLKAIGNAKKLIYIETPYFLPTESLLKALQTAALSKVDVRIIIPRKPDSIMLRLASGSYIGQCLKSGIKIYFYEPGMLHAKSIIIDDEISTTGSTNFDFRSMEYNFECNAFIYSKTINARMKEIFLADIENSTRITSTVWRHRPFTQKLKESFIRLLSPVL